MQPRARIRLASLLAGSCLVATGLSARADPAVAALSFLHVTPPGSAGGPGGLAQIRDEQGRSVLLRGVNVNGLEDYYQTGPRHLAPSYPVDPADYAAGRCPARNPHVESVPVCQVDAGQLAAFGYNAVRLAVSWSSLEPTPGHLDDRYLRRVAQVVTWLGRRGIYSVIDLHQDAWSKFLVTGATTTCPPGSSRVGDGYELDGAPAWATPAAAPVCAVGGTRELDAAVQTDFQRFWTDVAGPDGVGLQEHFASVVTALARRFRDVPAVAGYDLFNEPSPGLVPTGVMAATELFPFYAKTIAAVTAAVPRLRQLFFIEPDILRDVTDVSPTVLPWSAYSPYRGVVYAPHIYTQVFTADEKLSEAAGTPTFQPPREGYASAAVDARRLGLALWVSEFGGDVDRDATLLAAHYRNQERLGIGSSLWVWKADTAAGFSVLHGPFGPGTAFPSRVTYTARAYPIATVGQLLSQTYDPLTGSFTLIATTPSASALPTVVSLPARSRGRLRAFGARLRTVATVGGARLAYLYPGGGRYGLTGA